MDSDEQLKIIDPQEAAWACRQRERVIEYLAFQNVEHDWISVAPRWFLSPYIAIWAVRSKTWPENIGWWAISGDCPTDYITSCHERDNADVLMSFARQWKAAAMQMSTGAQLPGYTIGPPGHEKEFAPMILSRAELLEDIAKEIKREAIEKLRKLRKDTQLKGLNIRELRDENRP